MAKQSIGLGSSANDGNGDTLRAAGTKINANTDEIYARFGSGTDLETATSANILVGNGTKFASVATSGDFNISSAGAINVRTTGAVSKITIPSGSAPDSTTNALYNIGGSLYFNGSVVGTGNVTGMTAFSITGDSGSAQSVTQGNTVTIAGGTGITSAASATDTITLNIDSTVATLTGTQTLTNKTLTSPVLGGTTTTASGNLIVDPATQILEVKGDGSSTEGGIQLNCRVNTHGQKILAQPHSEGVTNTMLLPKGADSTLVSEVSTSTLTNKTIDANGTGNSITNLEVADFAAASIVTQSEGIGSNNNDTTIPTSAAVKAYADSVGGGGGGSTIVVQDEGSALSTNATTLNFVGAGVVASGTGAVKTITVGAGVSTLAGLSDTAISSANGGQLLLHDGSDSFDNKDINLFGTTLNFTAGLSLFMGAHIFNITGADGSNYTFQYYEDDGTSTTDPALVFIEDHTYVFNLAYASSSHPFQIQTTDGNALTNSNGARGLLHIALDGTVSEGTSANGKHNGFMIWRIPHFGANSTGYRYRCTQHSGMGNTITIKTTANMS
tara:strand:+ start:326 stop:1996 length:1671 start_codon:yes stop_codon:yes gene_type:complete